MTSRRTVLLHGSGARVPVLAERLNSEGARVDLLSSTPGPPDSAAEDLAVRGIVRLVHEADPWAYDEVYRLVPPSENSVATADDTDSGAAPMGRIILVGGGPGAPGLITVAGLAALREADVVLCDRLVPLGLLDELPKRPVIVHVGKIPHGAATPQAAINARLIDEARRGRTVVRLKGGDGYVLGRGGEEVEAARAANVPVQVVPGVSSAISVPGLAGIPVTHRGLTQGFIVVSGHVPPGDPRSETNWEALATSRLTLVILMGVGNLRMIADYLIAAGLSSETPAAIVERGSLPEQHVHSGALGRIADTAESANVSTPATIVIGEVVGLLAGSRPDSPTENAAS